MKPNEKLKSKDLKVGWVIYAEPLDPTSPPGCWIIHSRKEDDDGWWLSPPDADGLRMGIADWIFDGASHISDYSCDGLTLEEQLDKMLTMCP